jgi:hypothetical protein
LADVVKNLIRAALLLSVVAASLARLPSAFEKRRRGPLYTTAKEIDRARPPGERLAVISDGWNGLFFDYYLYPRPTRLYRDLAAYRLDDKHPQTMVYVTGGGRVMTYDAIRAEQMTGFISTPHSTSAGTHFLVPLVASFDGYPPASYTTEAWLSGKATVTLHPQEIVKTLTKSSYNDFVHEVFGASGTGWLEVSSDAPIDASFALVNRGTKSVSPIAIVRDVPPAVTLASGEKLWLINPTAAPANVRACGNAITLPPYAIESRTATFPCEVTGAYAFASQKLPDGGTRFTWP